MPTPRIDAHHHLWHYTPAEYGWIDASMAALQRDFLPADLVSALHSANIPSAIAVQARQSLEETHFLLDCAATTPQICAVVGWVPLASDNSDDLSATLDRFSPHKKLVGFREIVQGQPAGYLDEPNLNRGIAQLTARNYTYDILIYQHQLEEAIRFVDRHPHQRFILDHAAKPRIAAAELEPWATHLRALAARPNVACKVSGLVTEAHWQNWSLETLRPYLDTCVEAFGPHRLLAGSDWPVCLVASTYAHWWSTLEQYFAPFSSDEKQRIFGLNAIDLYRIPEESL